jgi:AraC-like DNA-binding protein
LPRAFSGPAAHDPRISFIEEIEWAATPPMEEWAAAEGLSCRTLARLFFKEVGITFRHWRHQMRVLAAAPRLAVDEPVTAVAIELGYETPGTFAATFCRVMGTPHSRYFVKAV